MLPNAALLASKAALMLTLSGSAHKQVQPCSVILVNTPVPTECREVISDGSTKARSGPTQVLSFEELLRQILATGMPPVVDPPQVPGPSGDQGR